MWKTTDRYVQQVNKEVFFFNLEYIFPHFYSFWTLSLTFHIIGGLHNLLASTWLIVSIQVIDSSYSTVEYNIMVSIYIALFLICAQCVLTLISLNEYIFFSSL